jgi:restriction endonuclease S subunit
MIGQNSNTKHFIIQRSDLEGRIDPQPYHIERREILKLLDTIKPLLKLKNVVRKQNATTSTISDNVVYVGLENIKSDTGEYVETNSKESISSAAIFKRGQILFPKLRPYLNKVYLAEFDGICSTEFHIFDTKSHISNEFLAIYLRSKFIVKQTKHLMTGNTLPRLQTSDIENLPVPDIDKQTQQKIVDLYKEARQTRRQKEIQAQKLLNSIDTYLLNELGITIPEKDNSLESRMFTVNFSALETRFDPFYHLEYFKEIESKIDNSRWDVVMLQEIFDIKRGGSPRPIHSFYTDDPNGLNWIKIGDTKNDDKYIFSTKEKIIQEGARYSRKVVDGDFILSNSMSFGRPYIVKIEGYIHDGWLLFRPKTERVNNDFLHSLLSSELMYQLFRKSTIGGVVENLNIDLVKKVKVPLPLIDKQNEIANHISDLRNRAKQLQEEGKAILNEAKATIEKMILN